MLSGSCLLTEAEVEMKTFFVKEYDEMEIFFDAIDDGNIHILFALIPDQSLGIKAFLLTISQQSNRAYCPSALYQRLS